MRYDLKRNWAKMEKQYSVQFFTNFVENLQNLCHTYLDFSQSVEVSGYVCVEIDNVKKERYVLSEMIQSNSRSISESYCTKVFKSTPSGPVQRSNFRDITNETSSNSVSNLREANVPYHAYTTGIQRVTSNIRHQAASSSPSNTLSRQSISQTRTSFHHQPQSKTSTSPSHHSSSSDSQILNGDKKVKELQRHSSLGGNKTDFEFPSGPRPSSSCSKTTDSNFGKRRFSDTSVLKSESADDGDVVIIKEEPGTVEHDEEDSGEPPPVKRRGESFRLPEALSAVQGHDPSSEDDFQDSQSSFFELPTDFPAAAPDVDSFLVQSSKSSSGHFPAERMDSNTSVNTAALMHRIHPPPVIVNTPTGTNIVCQLCRNSTPSEMSFVMHMNAHPSCRECGVFVGTHMDLRNHIQAQHGKTSMHKCKFCEKAFLTRSGMIEHQRLKHENTAPRFVCVICGHVCVRRRHLEDHLENVHKKKNKGPS